MATGFMGSEGVESFIKSRIGHLAEGCEISYVPFPDDIRKGLKSFWRYEAVCNDKNGDLIVHYNIAFDSSGKIVPDPIRDRIQYKLMQGHQ